MVGLLIPSWQSCMAKSSRLGDRRDKGERGIEYTPKKTACAIKRIAEMISKFNKWRPCFQHPALLRMRPEPGSIQRYW
jgi:hypothetical protein